MPGSNRAIALWSRGVADADAAREAMPTSSQPSIPRALRIAVSAALGVAALALLIHVGVAVPARHSLTQVESIVAIHARMLAQGESLYSDLNSFPYTVSPYGPLFYGMSALLQTGGLEPLQAGRLISIIALLATLWLCYRLMAHWEIGELERRIGLALAASAGVIGNWGVVGQSDMLALAFSVAAIERYAAYEGRGDRRTLAAAGLFIVLAIFTKQSFIAAGAVICVALLLRERRRGWVFAAALAAAGVSLALGLQAWTAGGYLENALLANLNPFAWSKLGQHLQRFVLVAGGLAIVAGSALARRGNLLPTLHLYTGFSLAVWLLTAPKIGSDLNYQLEPTLALCLAAAWSLQRLRFFELVARQDPGWVTLLQLPLLLHLALNVGVAVQSGIARVAREQMARQQLVNLAPWLEPARGRLLSVEIDPLLHVERPLEVEPLIYTLLVGAGVTDPAPLSRALQAGEFSTVLLYQDFDGAASPEAHPELPSLPPEQLEILRSRYRRIAHVPGPLLNGVYVYEPAVEPAAHSRLLPNQ